MAWPVRYPIQIVPTPLQGTLLTVESPALKRRAEPRSPLRGTILVGCGRHNKQVRSRLDPDCVTNLNEATRPSARLCHRKYITNIVPRRGNGTQPGVLTRGLISPIECPEGAYDLA